LNFNEHDIETQDEEFGVINSKHIEDKKVYFEEDENKIKNEKKT